MLLDRWLRLAEDSRMQWKIRSDKNRSGGGWETIVCWLSDALYSLLYPSELEAMRSA